MKRSFKCWVCETSDETIPEQRRECRQFYEAGKVIYVHLVGRRSTDNEKPYHKILQSLFSFGVNDYPGTDNARTGVLVAYSVMDLSKPIIPVRVANMSDKTRIIQKGEVLTAYALVTCVDRKCNNQDIFSDDLVKDLL
ncbi:hypothetical protein TNCV_3980971 [Trichonephila clavipes]|nr:hypothetical protein TNCV_3980971 [Trichonephila clavipes]